VPGNLRGVAYSRGVCHGHVLKERVCDPSAPRGGPERDGQLWPKRQLMAARRCGIGVPRRRGRDNSFSCKGWVEIRCEPELRKTPSSAAVLQVGRRAPTTERRVSLWGVSYRAGLRSAAPDSPGPPPLCLRMLRIRDRREPEANVQPAAIADPGSAPDESEADPCSGEGRGSRRYGPA